MEELNQIECPICKESFKDKRGLTSHARNKHKLSKDKILEKLTQKENDKEKWKILGGFGALLLAVVGIGRFR